MSAVGGNKTKASPAKSKARYTHSEATAKSVTHVEESKAKVTTSFDKTSAPSAAAPKRDYNHLPEELSGTLDKIVSSLDVLTRSVSIIE